MSAPATYATGLTPLPTAVPEFPKNILDRFSLKGKVASITGSSSGIGFAVAEAFAQAGADVAIWYNSKPADAKAEYLSKTYGVKSKAYKCLVTDDEQVKNTIQTIEKDFGKIDIFIANAGIPWTAGPMIDVPDNKEWDKVVNLDLTGSYYCAKYAGQIFKKQGHGSFIFTASMSGHIVNIPQMQACYNAAKAAVLHLSKSLAVEWAGFARCNTVSPGYMATEISDFIPKETKEKWWQLIPMGREGDPSELAGAYLYLASDASTYTTGADILVDGGYCCP
ncbi:putative NADP-dependent mannitol dehydrogenase [Yarrowia sp. B02]|nr:putative NADP-dependent mannitol dehydrogenase [Yarrowia sp. B02]